jgi:hypothetical protein
MNYLSKLFCSRNQSVPLKAIESTSRGQIDRHELVNCSLQGGTLEELLTRLIATQEGIRQDEVTVEYIHEQRKQHLYPTIRYDIGTEYGGYSTEGLKFFTQDELEDIEQQVDRQLAKL